ncbi:MAG: hypothetical protein HRT47_07865 [Candidatus Caenarcaniphilales bacterium]|nr:hypothetical protein [Candidatus Caenarcaniphilales bacterium]
MNALSPVQPNTTIERRMELVGDRQKKDIEATQREYQQIVQEQNTSTIKQQFQNFMNSIFPDQPKPITDS